MKITNKTWVYLWEEWVKPILVAVILAYLIRTFIAQPFKIPSSSMYPTLKVGDRIFVNKFIYGGKVPFTGIKLPKLRNPKLGDIVVFLSPIEKKKYLVKRYIAGQGDTVQITDGELFINGEKIKEAPFNKFFYYDRGEFGTEDKSLLFRTVVFMCWEITALIQWIQGIGGLFLIKILLAGLFLFIGR